MTNRGATISLDKRLTGMIAETPKTKATVR